MTHAIAGNRMSRLLRLPCADACNRRRVVLVSPELFTGRIAVVVPPGEAAVFSPHEARMVAQQLLVLAALFDGQHQGVTQVGVGGRTP